MRKLFHAHTYLELQLNDEALEIYTGLQDAGLLHSTYIMAQVAITHHNQRGNQSFVFHSLPTPDDTVMFFT